MLNKKSSNLNLYCITIAINIYSFASGIAYSWTSPAIPKLNGSVDPENNPLRNPLTKAEESWVAALLSLGSALGPLVFSKISKKIGYKNSLIIGSIPFSLSYVILAYSNEAYLLYIGRLICGFGTGVGFTVLPAYIGEIADDSNRGKLGCYMTIILTGGFVFSYVLGPYMPLNWFSLINVLPPLIFLILAIFYIPESPYYFVARNEMAKAVHCIKLIRGSDDKLLIEKEIHEIQKNLKSLEDNVPFSNLFKERGLRKAIMLSMGAMFFQQFSGITPVLSYMQSIFAEAGDNFLSSEVCVIIVSVIVCIASGLTSLAVDKLGRKILLLCSCALTGLSQFTLGIFFCLKYAHYDLQSFSWLPILCLVIFVVSYYLGLGTVPWVLIGELFPSNLKTIAAAFSAFVCLFNAFVITAVYPYMSLVVGTGESFILFSCFCGLGFLFILILLPETKGKSLYDIQLLLNRS